MTNTIEHQNSLRYYVDDAGCEWYNCPDCGAGLINNVSLEWEPTPLRDPRSVAPIVRCLDCGDSIGAAYGSEVAMEIVEQSGITIRGDPSPGDRTEA